MVASFVLGLSLLSLMLGPTWLSCKPSYHANSSPSPYSPHGYQFCYMREIPQQFEDSYCRNF